jgi:tRNA(Ile2) C34 agmatinyltransferase TiaS
MCFIILIPIPVILRDYFGEVNVKCDRCNGTMIHEEFFASTGSFSSWRCLICGEVVDQTIMENRDHQNHGGEWDRRGKKWEK